MESNEIIITPHPGQVKVLQSKKRFILAAAGIQGGKTFCGCIWSQIEIQKQPDKNGLITALSQDQMSNVVLTKFFEMFPPYKQYYNKKERTLFLPSGGKVFFRSLEDPKYVEGITAYWAWMDEADLCGYKAYMVVRGRLNATMGRLLMTSSLADNSWLAAHADKFDPSEFDVFSWASNVNPAFSQEEWESMKAETDPVIFRRRYEAQLQFATGKVYDKFDKDKHIVTKIPKDDPVKRYFIGIDWGYVDPTAIIVIGLTERNNVYIIDEFVVEGAPMDLISMVILKYRKRYKNALIYADPSNKLFLKSVEDKIATTLEPGTRDIYFGTSLIRNLIFQDRFYCFEDCKRTIYELTHYSFMETTSGRSEEPEDKNNHCLDAIRYVLATYPIPKAKTKEVIPQEEMNPFWERRKPAYKNEMNKKKTFGIANEDVYMP